MTVRCLALKSRYTYQYDAAHRVMASPIAEPVNPSTTRGPPQAGSRNSMILTATPLALVMTPQAV
jgi:hypothetical protein